MKILTNIRFVKVAGIAQTLSSLIDFIEKSKKEVKIVGVDLSGTEPPQRSSEGGFSLISHPISAISIKEAIRTSAKINDLENHYQAVTAAYREAIKQEQPDVILINGTYYLPWCLLQASRDFSIPTILHYHGSLTKETEHWQPDSQRLLFQEMERQFDRPNLFYIFPSALTKEVVEKEVFKHTVKKYSILPNPVPLDFFAGKPRGKRKKIGIVSRWTPVKNPSFIARLAKYNFKHGSEYDLNIVSDLKPDSKHRKNLDHLVTFHQPMGNERLSAFYRSMGVVLSPSRFETYGNVAKEALASGVPALVSDRMGVAETFRELGLENWITDFRSVRSVYAKIKETVGEEVPQSVRNELREKHSSEYIHDKLINIVKSV